MCFRGGQKPHVKRSVYVNLLNQSQKQRENLEWFLFIHSDKERKKGVKKI